MNPSDHSELDRMIAVMEASKTQKIQHKFTNADGSVPYFSLDNKWYDSTAENNALPKWNWGVYDYRVKPPDKFHITYYRAAGTNVYHGPKTLERESLDSTIEFIELTPEVRQKLGL